MWTKVVEGTYFNVSNGSKKFLILYSLQKWCLSPTFAIAECGLGGCGSSAAAWIPSTMLGTRLEQPQTMRRAAVGMEFSG